jgi:hypothetical protein
MSFLVAASFPPKKCEKWNREGRPAIHTIQCGAPRPDATTARSGTHIVCSLRAPSTSREFALLNVSALRSRA